jgi:endonuclease I
MIAAVRWNRIYGRRGHNTLKIIRFEAPAGLFVGACLLLSTGASADWNAVALSDTVVAFGVVNTGEVDSTQMSITNFLSVPVQITDVGFDGTEFSTNLTCMELSPLTTESFDVYFTSEQNVNYTDFLHIDLAGSVRSLMVEVSAEAHHPDTYYSGTQNKWAEDLKDTLTEIIDGHTSLGYTLARDHMYSHIDNVDGWVECVYTGRTAYFSTREGANNNGFNCEHTWPQSFSGEAEPMRSDIFHLYPSDVTANSMRASLDFGIVTSATWTSGGSKLGTDSTGQTVFEPRDVHKGNVARSHFYYIIRYDGNYNGYVSPAKMEAHFRNWHVSDPVDSAEMERNEEIYALQDNRNPFIDHPEFADRISSFFGTAVRVLEPEITVSPMEVDLGTIGFDSTAYYHIAIVNSGDDSLHVSSISSTDPDFSVSMSAIGLAPKSYAYVWVGYTSGSTQADDTTTVLIASEDADEGLVEVPVTVHVTDLAGIERDDAVPGIFSLRQNRPNPFGERTTIGFELARASEVDLSVYSATGRLVSRLLDAERMLPGEHRVEFAAGGLPPGVYYCRLRAGGRVDTRLMVLLK